MQGYHSTIYFAFSMSFLMLLGGVLVLAHYNYGSMVSVCVCSAALLARPRAPVGAPCMRLGGSAQRTDHMLLMLHRACAHA